MCRNFQRRNALFVLLVGSVLAALISSDRFILNTTTSVPRGIWLKLDDKPKIGDFMQVPIDAFTSTDWVPHEYFRLNMWGQRKPFIKLVAGLQGDVIEQSNNGLILINGVPFHDSAPLSHDRAGRLLRPSVLPIVLASDEVWLLSESPFGFDSRYLGVAKLSKCRKAVPLLTF